jgi:two-component system, response regulator PdtaR
MTGKTILVVEDEGLIALHLTELLEDAGYTVPVPVYSGETAIKALEISPLPDLILMDVGLTGEIDGIRTAELIRERFSVPIIFVTAYNSEKALERMREVAPCGVIIKPFKPGDLLDLIKKALQE